MGCAFVHADAMHVEFCRLEAGGAPQLRDANVPAQRSPHRAVSTDMTVGRTKKTGRKLKHVQMNRQSGI